MAEHTRPSAETREEEAREAAKTAEPGRPPTDEESAAADRNQLDPDVAEHEREMLERGAGDQGEGRLP